MNRNLDERLMRYCMIDTTSDSHNDTVTPSTQKQFDLARLLYKELTELGMSNVRLDEEHCYVYATLPGNVDKPCPTVGFIAHMDTVDDFSGTGVKPRIIENFDGEDIVLNEERTIRMDTFPWMRDYKGMRIMVAGGDTLLGADDKAGIAAIMETLVYLKEHPEVKHGDIAVGFTPDEEIGNGVKYFDVPGFGADFAYTLDGDEVHRLSVENFNAVSAYVTIKGVPVHPGSAKDKMINAARIGCEFVSKLPGHMVPEHTEGYEGFIHLLSINADCSGARLEFIVRDHDRTKLCEKCEILKDLTTYMNRLYGEGVVTTELVESYQNMYEVLEKKPEIIEVAREAIRDIGYEPEMYPMRGGTDGSGLTFMGLPCPNLGTGGGNFHGPYEYCVMDNLEKSVEMLVKISEKVALLEK